MPPPVLVSASAMIPSTDDATTQAYRLAIAHHQAGRLAEAEAEYRRVLQWNPRHALSLYGLGTLALQVDRHEVAEKLIRSAIALKGEWPEACYHLGLALQGRDQFDAAIAAHRRAIAINPALFDAHYQLAVCLQLSGEVTKALGAYRNAIALNANDPVALVNFGIALRGARQLDECVSTLRRAVSLKPDLADAYHHLGLALREKGLLDEAIAACRRARELAPRDAASSANLAAVLWETGHIDEATAIQRDAVALSPDDPEAHCVLGALLLLNGEFREGFSHWGWRWRQATLPWPRRRFSQPQWDGGDLAGRTIYLHAEQSIGDAIQFLRFIPLVRQRGGRVIAEVQPSLRRLCQSSWQVEQWLSPGEPIPSFDVYAPLLSLPGILGMTPSSIPADVPYLRVPHDCSQVWQAKMPRRPDSPLRVGLAWAGSPSELHDRLRSVPLSHVGSALRTILLPPEGPIISNKVVRSADPTIEFFSLQKGRPAAQARDPDVGITLTDFTAELADFADTAALISQLDLVITVDTAVAHLAGALGKPVWTLLPFVPHWRWMRQGDTTPWYPTMRLFRQTERGNWSDVIQRVAEELRQFVEKRAPTNEASDVAQPRRNA